MTTMTGDTTGRPLHDPISTDLKTTLRALKLGKMLDWASPRNVETEPREVWSWQEPRDAVLIRSSE
ncbi:hypothetical protein ACIBQ1_61285, partial [Nonomuraea sp. NPDC050153]|uniref:hypothetical protein n=1 Tax=Nonomuraea sp. NPDC050153 TaxID=3364359 RepID=UPI0037B1E0AC